MRRLFALLVLVVPGLCAAQFQGLRATSTGNTAVYTCDGAVLGPTRSPTSSAPSALSGSSAVTPAPPPPPDAASGPPKSLTTAPTQ